MTESSAFAPWLTAKRPAKVAVIGAMEQEVAILREQIEHRERLEIAGYQFDSGQFQGVELVLLQSGIGKVNAAISTTLLLDHFQPDCVINTGSAGGFDPALKVGDVVISSGVCHHDVDVTAFDYAPGQVPGCPAVFTPDATLAELAAACIAELDGLHSVAGLIATGDSFMHDPARVAATRARFPAMQAVEMEAAAIAQTCHQFGVPFIVIRALSDIAGQASDQSFAQFLETAARHSAAMVTAIVRQIGLSQPS